MPTPARTGRADHDQIFRSHSIPPGEPYFVLRAQDKVAVETVRGYVQLAKDAGADDAFLELAARQADAMASWPKKKLPDVELEDPERKQLAYAWGRRRWNRGAFSAEAIAEARGRASTGQDPLERVACWRCDKGQIQTFIHGGLSQPFACPTCNGLGSLIDSHPKAGL